MIIRLTRICSQQVKCRDRLLCAWATGEQLVVHKVILSIAIVATLAGCRIENVGPQGITATRPVYVNARDVQVYERLQDVPGHYTVIEDIWVDDDGVTPSDVLVQKLRVRGGGLGANAIVLDGFNRADHRSGTAFGFSIDDKPVARAKAVWIGAGPPPVRKLR